MLIAIFGDMHGNSSAANGAMEWAKDHGANSAIWVGDCGLWTDMDNVYEIDRMNARAMDLRFTNFWVGGNHEHWPEWNAAVAPVSKGGRVKDQWGFSLYRSNIRLAPRVHTWKMGGKWWAGLAGAASIDRRFRKAGKSWFPEELITEDEIASIESINVDKVHINYLVTHDAATNSPFGFHLIDDVPSFDNRTKIDRAVRHLHPDLHFHGHYHKFMNWQNGQTITFGMNMEWEDRSIGILNTDNDTFMVRTIQIQF